MKPGQLRALGATILSKLLQQQGSLATLLERPSVDAQEFPLLQEICFGTCRWYFQLDAMLAQLLEKPLKPKDLDVRCLLLTGLYQLHYLRVPEYAVVNETVAATLVLKKQWAKGFVNAILRSYLRDKDEIASRALLMEPGRFAHPQWFVSRMKAAWPEHWRALLAANNEHPPMTLRVNLRRMSRPAYLAALLEAGITARAGILCASSIYLEAACPVTALPGFEEGLISVQDEASQLIPGLLELQPGLAILDACAAPGGKTCHLLESGFAFSRLVAIDNDVRRLERVKQNLQRLQLQADVICGDAGQTAQWWDGNQFDRILLDAPCSATGIIRRHPDIKLLRRPDHVLALQEIQLSLLKSLWACLKPGGLLLYSTCSVLPEENSDAISAFIACTEEAKLEEIPAEWGVECQQGRQLLPSAQGQDGFYFARLRKAPH
jgi:16S rRNA (cytosine967-C5)-methyltransferase